MKTFLPVAFVLLLAGCASNGADLMPGKTTASEAQQSMGKADQEIRLANGDTALYFSRQPLGRTMYVVTFGPDGVMKSKEQRMQYSYFAKVVGSPGTELEFAL